jgi:acetyltransferase-like isoleucine patch superfamily enzyme
MPLRNLLLRVTDPVQFIASQKTAHFRSKGTCGVHFAATERASFFMHSQNRRSAVFGEHSLIDGTVEVYDQGVLTTGANFFLGRSRVYCAHRVTIGNYVLVSDNVSIMDSDLHPIRASQRRAAADQWAKGVFPDVYADTPGSPVVIDDDVWIGFGASILKGVHIGQGAIIGAGSLVNCDVPAWTVVAGQPARPIRTLDIAER